MPKRRPKKHAPTGWDIAAAAAKRRPEKRAPTGWDIAAAAAKRRPKKRAPAPKSKQESRRVADLEAELKRERARSAGLERDLDRERARGADRILSAEERIRARAQAATKRKAMLDAKRKVERFGPLADLAARRMLACLATVGDGGEVAANSDASADGFVMIPWLGNVFDSLLMVSGALEAIPADYWISFRVGFVVPDSKKVKTRLRRSDIEAAPYRRATYWRRASASHVSSARVRLEEIAAQHADMGSVPFDIALALHWNPDNHQPNRYQEGMDRADAVHGREKKA